MRVEVLDPERGLVATPDLPVGIGFDGIRLLIVHYFDVTEYRKSLFYAAFAVSVIMTIVGGLPMLLFALE